MSKVYTEAGVSLERGYESIERIRGHIASTKSLGFNGDIGGFGGLFNLFSYRYEEPILVSGTDGVGTKLLLAIEYDAIDTIGIDLVAMCVNDIITTGADPLFFLDYIAVGKNSPTEIERIVSGIAAGCRVGRLSLIGGETAEMPEMYPSGHFDLAGFAVGAVERRACITGEAVSADDVIIGIPSSGIHSNGYSLVRKILRESKLDVMQTFNEGTLLDALLEPTRIYVDVIDAVKRDFTIEAMAHITGGGFTENLPRMISNPSLGIELDMRGREIPRIFEILMQAGGLDIDEMSGIFNMGIGFVVVVDRDSSEEVVHRIRDFYPEASILGTVSSEKGVRIRW